MNIHWSLEADKIFWLIYLTYFWLIKGHELSRDISEVYEKLLLKYEKLSQLHWSVAYIFEILFKEIFKTLWTNQFLWNSLTLFLGVCENKNETGLEQTHWTLLEKYFIKHGTVYKNQDETFLCYLVHSFVHSSNLSTISLALHFTMALRFDLRPE